MSALETKVPPPILLFIVTLVMILSTGGLHVPALPLLGAALAAWVAGIGMAAAAMIEFMRAGTTADPHSPQNARSIISTGIFHYTRNPIYLAFILLLLGLALFLATPWALLGPLAYALYIGRFQVAPEERALSVKFGTEYEQYRTRVRRWL
jgi:protein-S-isoprenylcysteine O-methyltransferase Ste14